MGLWMIDMKDFCRIFDSDLKHQLEPPSLHSP